MSLSTVVIPEPGDVIANKYIIERHLAKGAMGLVAEARHTKLEQRVAIKFMLPKELERPDAIRRFAREARAAARLRSPYAVRVLDVDETKDGLPFIVMEYLEGRDLGTVLKQRSVIPVPEAVDWMLQACAALAEAHGRGIIHRDLKPANLFLADTEDGSTILKVTDFGVAKLTATEEESDLTSTGAVLGTPHYMAPEQLLNANKVAIDHRIDVWSLGVVLYRLLSGKLPITAGDGPTAIAIAVATTPPVPLASVAPELPEDLCAAIMKAISRPLAKRWPDITSFANAIERFGSGKLTVAALATAPGSSGKFPSLLGASEADVAEATRRNESVAETTRRNDAEATRRNTIDVDATSRNEVDVEGSTTEMTPPAELPPPTGTTIVDPPKKTAAPMRTIALAGVALGAVLLLRFLWPAGTAKTEATTVGAPPATSAIAPAPPPPPAAPLQTSPPVSSSEPKTAAAAASAVGSAPSAKPALPKPAASARPSRRPDASSDEDPLHL